MFVACIYIILSYFYWFWFRVYTYRPVFICSLIYLLTYKWPAILFAVYLFVFSTNKLRPMFNWTPQLYSVIYLLLYLWALYSSEYVWVNGGIHPRILNISTKGECSVSPSSKHYLQWRNTHTRGWVGLRVTLDAVGRTNISFLDVNRTQILRYSSSSFVSVLTKHSWLLV